MKFAVRRSADEIVALTGGDQFFTWFNRGSILVSLQDYGGTTAALDDAFTLLSLDPRKTRPWRMMWYRTGPYWACYSTGRYQDVIDLATKTLDNMNEPVLEESYYWRALARKATDDTDGALEDFQPTVNAHLSFEPALEQLKRLRVEPE